ncbi:MAG: sugar transferase [Pseudomonadota bacterium]
MSLNERFEPTATRLNVPNAPGPRAGATLSFLAADVIAAFGAAAFALFAAAWIPELITMVRPDAAAFDPLAAGHLAGTAAFGTPDALFRVVALTALLLGALAAFGLYAPEVLELDEGRRAFAAGLLVFLVHGLPDRVAGLPAHGVSALAAALILAFGVTGLRMVLRTTPWARRGFLRPTVLLGRGMGPDRLRNHLRESRGLRETPAGGMDLDSFLTLAEKPDGREELSRRLGVDTGGLAAVLAPSVDEMARVDDAVAAAGRMGLEASLVLPYPSLARSRLAARRVFAGDLTLLDVTPARASGATGRAVKRAFDFLAAGAALIVLSPVLLGVMLALKASYGWRASIFFSQRRVGQGRRRFDCLKFRTMAPDAEQRLEALLASDPVARREWATHQKLSNDPRITAVGGFLRKTSLDELPQLLNVVRGDMSLVGPRPIVAPEVPGYVNDAAYYESPAFSAYAELRPGVTGLWQVSGRAATAYSERMRLDAWYAANWSLWLDVVIVLKTARAAILGGGAS